MALNLPSICAQTMPLNCANNCSIGLLTPAGKEASTVRAAAVTTLPTVEIRAWAKKNGYGVASRGRIPAEVVEAYQSRIAG
jgi:hypothetical protein